MKKFFKIVLLAGISCLLAGGILLLILAVGFKDEVREHWDELSINEENFLEFVTIDEYKSITRRGKRYTESDTRESYYYSVPEGEKITGIDFEFAVGEVEIREGTAMEITVTDMFENAISGGVRNGVWYIEDSLMDSGSVHSGYSPKITITIPEKMCFEQAEIHLAAGVLNADVLAAEDVYLEVDAGSLKVFELLAEESLEIKNGVGEIRVYDVDATNLTVDNGIGSVSFTGAISGNNTVNCGIGEVEIILIDRSRVDFNYFIDCGIGEVVIDGNSYNGTVERNTFDRSTADYFTLDCGIGRIEIDVDGN